MRAKKRSQTQPWHISGASGAGENIKKKVWSFLVLEHHSGATAADMGEQSRHTKAAAVGGRNGCFPKGNFFGDNPQG